jgi:hypothetical protein
MGIGVLSPEEKQPYNEADHSPPTSAEVNKVWIYISTALYVFMEYKHKDDFTYLHSNTNTN